MEYLADSLLSNYQIKIILRGLIRDPNLTTAIIQKQHLISYLNRQDINGLIFLQNTDQNLKDYIQEYYYDSQGTMTNAKTQNNIPLLTDIEYENANVQNWASQKKGAVIKAGLNKSHQKLYISGKYLSLVKSKTPKLYPYHKEIQDQGLKTPQELVMMSQ
ncbi:predicted protein [Aspergillus nidulans FGSC A4]|uniref:Uncharacterized protein n=1 Tax=Emericella nidulans (strain FGSC A4 / ATCC 38163 / CBS 112.46 / NRRL 194 / M139) TaxID=227321 RepID=Q5AXA2_EMENI|nr:hypothetical protein [Aspergillus nidulans FGSC A4]EAA61207.1 predicted protein [Aspergillus nidulans FGSC A4]CBF79130.1 TPA: conserved hypothetical protein [Aspergillus nidulans FGSC A4]|eukprot:XP_664682.1 predicted protein [Aspergillus nidulans FGSC A4]